MHRDIKPANVLVPPDGHVKVTDFGIAKAGSGAELTRTGTVVGTARYLAPEQLRGEPVDARTDLYALGLVLYEMLAGELPFHGDTDMATALARLSTPPAPLPPSTPPGVAAIVERCLSVDPAGRYPSAAALAQALAAVSDRDATAPNPVTATLPVATPPAAPAAAPSRAPSPPEPDPPRRHGRRWAAVAVVVLVLVAGGAVLAVRSSGGGGRTPTTTVAPAALPLSSAQDFDPLGDGHENHALVGLAIDGNPATAWPTEIYDSRNFGNAKAGVGIYVTLTTPATVTRVSVSTVESGWNGAIYAAGSPSSTLAGWGRPLAAGTNLGTQTEFTLRPPTRARVVLVWITNLPPSGKLDVAEIRVQ